MGTEILYNTKIISSGGRLEIYKYRAYLRRGMEREERKTNGIDTRTEEEKEEARINRRKTHLKDSKNLVVRIACCNPDMTSFITLTYKENMQDITKSKKQLNEFFKKLKIKCPELKYLYVMEFQERGAIHYHIMCNYPVTEGHSFNRAFADKFWHYGFVDCKNFDTSDIREVAKYISAYLTKDFNNNNIKHKRIFTTSHNVCRPSENYLNTDYTYKDLLTVEGHIVSYSTNYDIVFRDKYGQERRNNVLYYDYSEIK